MRSDCRRGPRSGSRARPWRAIAPRDARDCGPRRAPPAGFCPFSTSRIARDVFEPPSLQRGQPYQIAPQATTRNGIVRRFVALGARGFPGVSSCGKHAARGGPMQVSEILKVKGNALFTIAPEGKLTDAVSVMAQHNMGSLVVIDKGRMVGMLTFREILVALERGHGALGEARVGEIMEHDPVVASPGMDVNDLRRTMIDSGARYLPVMERDRLIGVISFRDVAKAVLEEQDFENRMLKGYIKNWPE